MTTPQAPVNGPVAAAVLSCGFGCFILGTLAVATDGSRHLAAMLNFYNPAGTLSGVTTVAVVLWLIICTVLAARWKAKTLAFGKVTAIAFLFLGLGLMLTFPPIGELIWADDALHPANAFSIAATSAGSSGVTSGEKRPTTLPSLSTRNFSKFHRIPGSGFVAPFLVEARNPARFSRIASRPGPHAFGCAAIKASYRGCVAAPVTTIFENNGKSTPKLALQNEAIS